jgi:methionyl-tRNA formyltransferase
MSKVLKVVFMGSPDFAVPSLAALIHSRHEVIAVATAPDKKRGRGSELSPTPVKVLAQKHGVPLIETDSPKSSAFYDSLKELDVDLFVVVAFKILPKNILDLPKIGSVNLHASLLPKYRGAAPIHWAIIKGEEETGNTIFFLNEKMDTGDILLQETIDIGSNETTGQLYKRLMKLGGEMIARAVDTIAGGNYRLSSQDSSKATPAPKIFKETSFIDFSGSCGEVHNKIRGMNPFPGAWTNWEGQNVKLIESRPKFESQLARGECAEINGEIFVGCDQGAVRIKQLQFPGRKPVSGREFLNANELPLRIG